MDLIICFVYIVNAFLRPTNLTKREELKMAGLIKTAKPQTPEQYIIN